MNQSWLASCSNGPEVKALNRRAPHAPQRPMHMSMVMHEDK